MHKQLLIGGGAVLALLGSFTSHAQTLNGDQVITGNLSVNGKTPTNGTYQPGELRVTGDTRITGDTYLGRHVSFANGNNGWYFDNNPYGLLRLIRNWDDTKSISFQPDGSVSFPQRVSIGNVTCQTTSSCGGTLGTNNTMLAVGGSIAAQGKITVINTGGTWPDYVFRRSYRLRPLAEVGRYVQAFHHLPDVPSAAQVQANGVELAEMNAVLLKKVEELTLYLLQLQAANQTLTERVAKLETTK